MAPRRRNLPRVQGPAQRRFNDGRAIRADDGNGKLVPSHKVLQWRLATDTGEVVACEASDVIGARISWRAADAGSSRETVRLYLASLAAEQGHRDVIAAAGGRLQRASEWDGSRSWHSFMSLISSSPTQVRARAAAIDARASAHICSCCPLRGISVVYYSNRCSLLLTAFCCILVHFNAFNKISLHYILMHFRSAACLRMRLHLNVFM